MNKEDLERAEKLFELIYGCISAMKKKLNDGTLSTPHPEIVDISWDISMLIEYIYELEHLIHAK